MENLTIYYSKSTGKVKQFCSGVQDMSFFGEDTEDFNLIWDFIVVEYDTFIIGNFTNFTVVEGQLKYTPPENNMSKYL